MSKTGVIAIIINQGYDTKGIERIFLYDGTGKTLEIQWNLTKADIL